jgi:hypothetical protein
MNEEEYENVNDNDESTLDAMLEEAIKAYRRFMYEEYLVPDDNDEFPEFDENIPRGTGEKIIEALWEFGSECCCLVNGDLLVVSRNRVRSSKMKRGLEIVRDVIEAGKKPNGIWHVEAFFRERIHDTASDDRTRFVYTVMATVLQTSILERISDLSDEDYERLWGKGPKQPPRTPEEILGIDPE